MALLEEPTNLDEWIARASGGPRTTGGYPIGKWRRKVLPVMFAAVRAVRAQSVADDADQILAAVDAAYPFGERAMAPYKAWLSERQILIAALKNMPPNAEEHGVCRVALDLVELGRIEDAEALLADQAPNRLNRKCQACGARFGKPCREFVDQWERGTELPKLVVPHEIRTNPNPIARRRDTSSGPLFEPRDLGGDP